MTTPDDVRRLEREFAEAINRLYAVGNGLARLRTDLEESRATHGRVAPEGEASPSASPPVDPRPTTATGGAAAAPTPPTPALPHDARGAVPQHPGHPVPASTPWYRREGAVTRVLAVAGAVVTLAGVAMLLVVAARHGWFGPAARVAAGAVLAGALAALGARRGALERARAGTVGAAPVALVATGGAAAYLDVVAVTSLYGWLPSGPGLVLAGGVALLGLWLARAWGSELLAVLMVAGAAALSPVVTGETGWVLSAFLGVLALAGWWAAGDRTRPVLTVVRSTPVALSLLAGTAAASGTLERLGLLAVALVVLLATLATSALSVRRDPRDVAASAALGTASAAVLVVTAGLPDPLRPTLLTLVAASLLLTASSLARPPLGPVAGHLVVVTAASGSLAALLAVLTGAPQRFLTTTLLLLAAGHLATAVVSRSGLALALGGATGLVALTAWVQHPLAVVTASDALGHDMVAALVDSLLAGGLTALGVWAASTVRAVPAVVRRGSVALAWAVGLVGSATALVALAVLAGDRLGAARLGFTVGQAAATVTWMVAAGWLLLRSRTTGPRADVALRGGLALAAVAVAKLFLYDLAALSGVVRSVAFIVTGLLLIATGGRYARTVEHQRSGRPARSG